MSETILTSDGIGKKINAKYLIHIWYFVRKPEINKPNS